MSGTSIAAPALSGAVALMLEANPGLTLPLIKAMLQHSAQPLPNANLLQQSAGLLNVDGAVALSKVLRTDITSAVNVVLDRYADYWDTNKAYVMWFWEFKVTNMSPVTSGVVDGSAMLGASSSIGKTGVFTLTPTASSWFISGSGTVLGSGIVMSEGVVIGEK